MLTRRATNWETFDFNIRSDLGLAFQVADKSAIPQILDNLDRSVIGLHLKFADGHLTTVPSPAIRHRLPDGVRDLQRAVSWLNEHHPIEYADRVGYLAFNDSKVVLNINHSVSDGGYLKFLCERVLESPPRELPPFPAIMEEVFRDEFPFAKEPLLAGPYDLELSRVFSRHTRFENPSPWAKFETIRFRGEELQCFNHRLKRFNDTTDYCWLGHLLACAVHSGELPTRAGFCTCVDLRPRIKKPVDHSHLKTFSVLNACTDFKPSMTLREIGARLRADMRRRESKFHDIAIMKFPARIPPGPPLKGMGLDVTNMGPLRIKWPIVDAWASIRIGTEFAANWLTIMTFSVMGERRNDLVVRFRFANSRFGEDEALAIAKSINHFWRHIPLERTIQSAFDELREVQTDL
jgi:hypothetical protein